MSLHLFTSNNTENLLCALARDIKHSDPLEKKWIVTSGRGIRVWIKQKLADLFGVSANLNFMSPEQAVWSFADSINLSSHTFSRNPFSKERMAWKIRQVLPELYQENPEIFRMIGPFLSEEDPLKRIQLCWEIAQTFDGYLHYRPELLENWENGLNSETSGDEEWQAHLWRRISSLLPSPSLHKLSQENNFAQVAPPKLFLFYFCPTSPVHLQAFAKYSSKHSLYTYFLQPTDQYWSEVLSNKEQLQRQSENRTGNDNYLELGPPLLGALGKSWQKLIFQLENFHAYNPTFITNEVANTPNSKVLGILQKVLLEMPEKKDIEPQTYQEEDSSLQIHSTHGPQREIEILHDFLLDQFNQDPSLKPCEILVLCPNLQKYSALIEAIFDNPEQAKNKIPYGLCDRKWRSESRVIDTFYHILEFVESRATARDFYTLLSRPAVRNKFKLEEKDLELIRWWIDQTNIVWGYDGSHKKSINLPDIDENTWQQGIDRMLLGFCGGSSQIKGFEDLEPFNEIEGEKLVILSQFIEALSSLKALHDECSKVRKPSEWQHTLENFCIQPFFIEDEESHSDLVEIRKSIGFLTDETLEHLDVEPLSVIRFHLEKTLNEKSLVSRHLTYGVTFASLRSARGIPAKVICLLGMNGGEFPSTSIPSSFDLCRKAPKYSDRNSTEEDRLLVLEAILCARKTLYISYQGQSNKNNSTVPPSVVIEEILDQINDLINFPSQGGPSNALDAYVINHPLQLFSRNYFLPVNEPMHSEQFFTKYGCRSFSKTAWKGAIALSKEPKFPGEFCPKKLENVSVGSQVVSLKDLAFFWKSPCKYFLENVLLTTTREEKALLPENERLGNSPLQDSSIKRDLITRFLDGENLQNAYQDLRKKNLLPPGQIGKALYASLVGELRGIFDRSPPDFERKTDKTPLDITLHGLNIKGDLGPFYDNTFFLLQGSKLKGKHCIEGFIFHIINNIYGPAPGNSKTLIGGIDKSFQFKSISPNQGQVILSRMIGFFKEGIQKPIPFFANASMAWLEQTVNHRTQKARSNSLHPIDFAKKNWINEKGGEGHEFATRLFFKNNPWDLKQTQEINETVMGFVDEIGEFVV